MEETLATLHPHYVFEDLPLGGVYHGYDGARKYYHIWWDAFDVTVKGSASHWTTTGDLIAEARYVGHHIGSFYSVAPTGRPIDLRFVVLVGFRDGLMVGERLYYDLASLLNQLGVRELPLQRP